MNIGGGWSYSPRNVGIEGTYLLPLCAEHVTKLKNEWKRFKNAYSEGICALKKKNNTRSRLRFVLVKCAQGLALHVT